MLELQRYWHWSYIQTEDALRQFNAIAGIITINLADSWICGLMWNVSFLSEAGVRSLALVSSLVLSNSISDITLSRNTNHRWCADRYWLYLIYVSFPAHGSEYFFVIVSFLSKISNLSPAIRGCLFDLSL